MIKINEKDYSHFNISERINLTIAALSRDDQEEIARLKRSCPKRRYTMLDYDYICRLSTLNSIIAEFSIICNFYQNKITLCKAFISMYHIFDEDNNPFYAKETRLQRIQQQREAYSRHVSHLKAVYNALSEFCEEVGLNYDHIIQWLDICPSTSWEFIDDKSLIIMVEPDQEYIDRFKADFLAMWESDDN